MSIFQCLNSYIPFYNISLRLISIQKPTFDPHIKMSTQVISLAKPIKEQQVNRLLRLQQLFHQKFLTADLLNQLVATYVEAIECFDGFYSPMRKYFLQKIQYVLSRPEIDSMLNRNAQNDNMVGALRQTIRMTTDKVGKDEQVFSHAILMQAIELQNKKMKQFHEKNLKATRQKQKNSAQSNSFYNKSPQIHSQKSQQQKAQEHDKKIQMQMNLMKQVSENMKNLEMEVQNQDKKFLKKTKRINALMEEQNNSLEQRLAMRKRAKNRKKSGDQKFVQEVKENVPAIKKEELKQAQKEIAQAVERMTARLTQRLGTNKGATGLIVGTNNNDQKYRGRIKIRNQVRQEENQDQEFEQIGNSKKTGNNINKQVNKVSSDGRIQEKDGVKAQGNEGHNEGTARFTLGGESGGRGRIKRRDTNRLDEEDDMLL